MKLFVEGGGDAKDLRTECRAAFSEMFARLGIADKPRVVACGSRSFAYRDFCIALRQGEEAMLLVDSEEPVSATHAPPDGAPWQPWAHLLHRDGWATPPGATAEHCHLMVTCTENWLLSDPDALASFYGKGFRGDKLHARDVESIDRHTARQLLERASADCQAGPYRKSQAFKLLIRVDPKRLQSQAPWARRFMQALV